MITKILGYKCKVTDKNTKIFNSYSLTEKQLGDISLEIIKYRVNNGLKVTRSLPSYIKEIKSHIRLYKLGLFERHTKDTDLEEPIKWWVKLIYEIIGF